MAANWTPQQRTAIDARGGGLLVSAAAGSGKTAVLTERITARILDREHPVDANRFLVVTFTRAAAAEMKSRIRARLQEELAKSPGDSFLQRQSVLLSQAKICTMDAFFHSLVRENFLSLGLPPNLRGVDDAMLTRMTNDTLKALLEEQYLMAGRGENPDFAALTGFFGVENDGALSREILALYGKLRSIPFPERWLSRQLELYQQADTPPEETAWGKALLEEARSLILTASQMLDEAVSRAESGAVYSDKGLSALQEEAEALRQFPSFSWDGSKLLLDGVFAGHRLMPKRNADPFDKEYVKSRRDGAKKLAERAAALFPSDAEGFREDMEALYPVVRCFFQLTKDFSVRMAAAKEAAGVADFSDFAAFALKLVASPDGTPTPLGRSIAGQYEEIMVDEYQDTNRLQDMIFRCISKDGANLFFVGDLKQSIYRFRSANPAVFLEKKDAFSPYDGEHFPALIPLSKNFRSRAEVTGAVNYLFSCVMSREVGDTGYGEDEALHCGADYYPPLPEGEAAVTLQLLDGKGLPESDEEEPVTLWAAEAKALARIIAGMIARGEMVYDKGTGTLRPCRGGDFVILMRSVQSSGSLYLSALQEAGVGARLCTASGYFDSREVSLMMAMLELLDNPTRDHALAAVLLSPVFSFTVDDLSRLSLKRDGKSLYQALLLWKEEGGPGGEKAEAFLSLIAQLRRKAAVSRITTLIQYIYDQTDFIEVLSRSEGGGAREGNLRLLLKYAADYEAGGNSELSGFVSYIRALAEEGSRFTAAVPVAEAENAVRIMTVHGSKGLEFPVVALAGAGKRFNYSDFTSLTIFHPEMGFGMQRVEREALRRYRTIPYAAAASREKRDMLSEEVRLLYVALTRAKERLILCVSEKDLHGAVRQAAALYTGGDKPTPAAAGGVSNYNRWMLAAFLRHPAMKGWREETGADLPETPADFPLAVIEAALPEGEAAAPETPPEPDQEMEAALAKRFAWAYPHLAETKIPAKLSVTRLTHKQGKMTLSAPRFAAGAGARIAEEVSGDELLQEKRAAEPGSSVPRFTPAQQGTIFHRALQFAGYAAGRADPEGELRRLVAEAYLTPEEASAIDREEFAAFFRSELMGRMLAADEVLREYKFFDTIPASEAGYPGGGEAEILLQGIADCIFIEKGTVWLVDFKTDRVGSFGALKARYAGQLRLYRRAILRQPRFNRAGMAFGGCILYSTALKAAEEVDVL